MECFEPLYLYLYVNCRYAWAIKQNTNNIHSYKNNKNIVSI